MDRATPRMSISERLQRLFSDAASEGACLISPVARTFEWKRGQLLHRAGDAVAELHFVTEGLVAILGRARGGAAEAGLVGPGGVVGYQAMFGAAETRADAVALTSVIGVSAPRNAVLQGLQRSATLRRELFDYAAQRIAETERLCVCASLHSIEQRLARWLLQAAALLGPRPVEMTHQQFASIFGVRRASVTTSLHLLEGEMAIRCLRGRIEIRDLTRLEALSCGCEAAQLSAAGGAGRPKPPQTACSSASSTDSPRD